MENLLQGLPQVCVYLDDILVTGATEPEHLQVLVSMLKDAGARLNRGKCKFMMPNVVYLGHKISKDGLQPVPSSQGSTY